MLGSIEGQGRWLHVRLGGGEDQCNGRMETVRHIVESGTSVLHSALPA